MGMYDDKVVLCGANSYNEKYYLNPDFEGLPDQVKEEFKDYVCVVCARCRRRVNTRI